MNAADFAGIPSAVATHPALLRRILVLLASDPIAGKVSQGTVRDAALREVLRRFFTGVIDFSQAKVEVGIKLPRAGSPHSSDNSVFPSGWEERLVRTQVSRFYNQAVLSTLIEQGAADCFVAHSSQESVSSQCSRLLAGRRHSALLLLDRLIRSYRDGDWDADPKIPDHPHCTHTVQP